MILNDKRKNKNEYIISRRKINLDGQPIICSLSPDGRMIALVFDSHKEIYVINLESGDAYNTGIVGRGVNSTLSWSMGGDALCYASGQHVSIYDIKELNIINEFYIKNNIRIKYSSQISADLKNIYFSPLISSADYIFGSMSLREDKIDIIAYKNPKDIESCGGCFYFSGDFTGFSTISWRTSRAEGRHEKILYANFVDFSKEGVRRFDLELKVDMVNGVNNSGIMRQIPDNCMHSIPHNLYVVFFGSGVILDSRKVDYSLDSSIFVYDDEKKLISKFGGYGAIEGNHINGFYVHPQKPVVVTTASASTNQGLFSGGLVTLWDLRTGEALQRLDVARNVWLPMFSKSGLVLTTITGNTLNVYDVNI
ncbi:WD40 repeat domain-containing protein [Xanthobacter agilis]|uniref:hypothetical protein n=1 Tax=Xanthobacter agilis TaxID=47492 RepID=UPI00372C7AAF